MLTNILFIFLKSSQSKIIYMKKTFQIYSLLNIANFKYLSAKMYFYFKDYKHSINASSIIMKKTKKISVEHYTSASELNKLSFSI